MFATKYLKKWVAFFTHKKVNVKWQQRTLSLTMPRKLLAAQVLSPSTQKIEGSNPSLEF